MFYSLAQSSWIHSNQIRPPLLRDQAWDLTHIEIIGFLRLMKKQEWGRKLWVQERTEWCFLGSSMGTKKVSISLIAGHVYFLFHKCIFSIKSYMVPFYSFIFSFSLFHTMRYSVVNRSHIWVTLAPCWFTCFVAVLSSCVFLSLSIFVSLLSPTLISCCQRNSNTFWEVQTEVRCDLQKFWICFTLGFGQFSNCQKVLITW